MSNTLTIIILGLYTLVYVIVFFIQKAQIDRQKEVINSMKSFMEIFSIDEVKKYVETKTERMKMELEINLSKMTKKAFLETESYFVEMLDKETKKHVENFDLQYNEVCRTLFRFIATLPKEERLKFVEDYLPLTKNIFIKFLEQEKLI